MWRTIYCLFGILTSALLCSINAFTCDKSAGSRSRACGHVTMLKDDGLKPKIITPNDIGSLFGDSSKSSNKVPEGYDEDEDEDDIDYEEIAPEITVKATIAPAPKVAGYNPTPQKYDSESNSMRELLALQKEMMAPPKIVLVEAVEETYIDESSFEAPEEDVEVDDYLNFDRLLDKVLSLSPFPPSHSWTQYFSKGSIFSPRIMILNSLFNHIPNGILNLGDEKTCDGIHDND